MMPLVAVGGWKLERALKGSHDHDVVINFLHIKTSYPTWRYSKSAILRRKQRVRKIFVKTVAWFSEDVDCDDVEVQTTSNEGTRQEETRQDREREGEAS